MSQFCSLEVWVGSAEIKVSAKLCSFLETLGEESASRLIQVVGRIWILVAAELRSCFLAGLQPEPLSAPFQHFQSQQQHVKSHSHSEYL